MTAPTEAPPERPSLASPTGSPSSTRAARSACTPGRSTCPRARAASPAPSCWCTAPRWPRRRPSISRCPATARPTRRWTTSRGSATTSGASTARGTAAPTRRATSKFYVCGRRRRYRGRRRVHQAGARRREAADVRRLVRRAAGRDVRRAPPGPDQAADPGRLRLDRRGRPDPGAAPQAPARVPGGEPPPGQPGVRAHHLHAGPPWHRRSGGRRGVRGGDLRPGRLDPERHLRGHVPEPAAGRSAQDRRADPDLCAASSTASPASTTWWSSSACCRTPTSSSS